MGFLEISSRPNLLWESSQIAMCLISQSWVTLSKQALIIIIILLSNEYLLIFGGCFLLLLIS